MPPRRELDQRFRDHLSVLERLVEQLTLAIREFRDSLSEADESSERRDEVTDDAGSTSLCDSCEKRDTCTEACDALIAHLPDEDAGRRSTVQLTVNTHQQSDRQLTSDSDALEAFIRIRTRLTPRQWEVVQLLHGKQLRQCEIAKELGISSPTVSEHVEKAEAKLLKATRERSKNASWLHRLLDFLDERYGIDPEDLTEFLDEPN